MTANAPPVVGNLPAGSRNAITDVPGVSVGHRTLADGACQTGVTVIRPHAGNVYTHKVPAAAVVLNGFGKSIGLVQVEELGVLETPIALTNTFGVGTVAQAQIRAAIAENPEIGRGWPTVNPLVFECNDGYLNDIQAMAVQEADYAEALAAAGAEVAQGAVGAGRGMSSFGVKGGIGTASRMAGGYTVGALVLSNFGTAESLIMRARPWVPGWPSVWLPRPRRRRARSSWSWPPMRRSTPGSFGAWRCAPAPASRVPGRSSAMAPATSRWPFPRPTPCPIWPMCRCLPCRWSTKRGSTRCSGPPPTAWSRPSSTPSGMPSQ